MKIAVLIAAVFSVVSLGEAKQVEINNCIEGKDVIIVADVRTDDEDKLSELLSFFDDLAGSVDLDDTRFYVMSYPLVFINSRTGNGLTTYLHPQHDISAAKSFIRAAINGRNPHPDFNVVLKDVNDLIDSSTRRHVEKTVLILSFNRYVPPASSEEDSDEIEEALETPSKVIMANLGEAIKKKAQVLIYALGTFENEYELYDLATCKDERCIFKLDDFHSLSPSHVLQGCPSK